MIQHEDTKLCPVPWINQRLVIPDPRRAGATRRIVKKVLCFFLSRKKILLFLSTARQPPRSTDIWQ
jgi:hypothetical protein